MDEPFRTDTYDVIVAGAGLAGLAAGATAQRAGARTVVLDAHQGGGRATTDDLAGGFRFNQGAHALYLGGPAARVLDTLGITPRGAAPALGGGRGLVGGELVELPLTPAGLLRSRLLGVRDKVRLARLLGRLPKLDPASVSGSSAAAWIADQGLSPTGSLLLGALIRVSTYAADHEALSAGVAVGQLAAALGGGVRYLDGGWRQLHEALADGLEVRPRSPVERIEDDGAAVVVQLAGGTQLRAGAVVVAVGSPAAAAALLPGEPAWGRPGTAVTAACLQLGLRRAAAVPFTLGLDEPLYCNTHCPPAQLAPPGHVVVELLRYGATAAAADRARLERLAAQVGVAHDEIVTQRFLARMVVSSDCPGPADGGLAGRPAPDASGLDRVYLAGDWVGGEGFLADASLASGATAGRAAADRRRPRVAGAA